MPMTPKEMIKFLQQNGFVIVPNNHGSHRKLKNPHNGKWTIVPMHDRELTKNLEHKILKQAGFIH